MASIFKTFGQDSKDPWETLLQDPQVTIISLKKSLKKKPRGVNGAPYRTVKRSAGRPSEGGAGDAVEINTGVVIRISQL